MDEVEHILLLGSSGKVGSTLHAYLGTRFTVHTVAERIVDSSLISTILNKYPISTVINCIGKFSNEYSVLKSSNIDPMYCILDAFRTSSYQPHLIHFSTGGVYAPTAPLKVEQDEPEPASLYNLSKYFADQLIFLHQRQHPRATVSILRPGSIFGDTITDGFLYHFPNQAKNGNITVRGSLNKIRSVANIDYISLLVAELCRTKAPGIFNVTTETITLKQTVDILKKKYSSTLTLQPDSNENDLLMHMSLDGKKAWDLVPNNSLFALEHYL